MAHVSLALSTLPSIETPMERIFEKVMLRKMTQKEKEILGLDGTSKSSRTHSSTRAIVSRKNCSHMRARNAVKLTSI
ncbi:MAG TPA: hypothetical protein VK709_01600 [Candidatus Saccharimonadales bacterium]|jgi:hypothetical protein|nr:hypothetical protein [Candidatus Saccharimonadales bacterium]